MAAVGLGSHDSRKWEGAVALWNRWTAPHPRVPTRMQQRRVRLAAGMLILLIGMSLLNIAVFIRPDRPNPLFDTGFLIPFGTAVLFCAALWLVRSPYPTIGIVLTVAIPWLMMTYLWSHDSTGPAEGMLYLSVLPVLLAGLLLEVQAATVFALFNVLGIAGLVRQAQTGQGILPLEALSNGLLFVLVVYPLVLVGSGFLQRSLKSQDETNERLRAAESYRTSLLHMIAHDLAAPLTPLQVQTHLLKAKHGEEKATTIMQRNLQHLRRLVHDIGDLASVENQRLSIDKQPEDLTALAQTAVDSLQTEAQQQDKRIRIACPDPLPIHADPDRLNQVLYNLIRNAIKFSPPKGIITVTAIARGHTARVTVRDQGRGLTRDEISRLFQPFSQVHHRGEVEERGTGLGLYISKAIIDAHGGTIGVTSDGHGKGSVFSFTVPLQHACMALSERVEALVTA